MSYDLMVFRKEVAPKTRMDFMQWYAAQTEWTEEHSYDDPKNTSDNLRNWFIDMIKVFPAMNGPFACEEIDNNNIADYGIGRDVIYVGFAWSVAEQAYEVTKRLAAKNNVGFFDASANDADILFPDGNGQLQSIDKPGNLSSIEEIKQYASEGQKDKSIMEILFSKLGFR